MKILDIFKLFSVVVFIGFLLITHKSKQDYFRRRAHLQGLSVFPLCTEVLLDNNKYVYTVHMDYWQKHLRWTTALRSYVFLVLPKGIRGQYARVRVKVAMTTADMASLSVEGMDVSPVGLHRGSRGMFTLDGMVPDHPRHSLATLIIDARGVWRGSIKDRRWLGVALSSINICPVRGNGMD